MGFADSMKKLGKDILKNAGSIGKVNSSDFPVGTIIHFSDTEGDASMTFTYPNDEKYIVTHDKVKKAEVLAMGVIDIKSNGNNGSTSLYGTKYRLELTDGKVAVLTVGLGNTLYKIEHIIF